MVLWILLHGLPYAYRALTVSSLAATEGISVDSFSSGYLDVSVHRVPFLSDDSTPAAGFPHSDTCGSMVTCTSPQLFAAYRVLLRLIWPRHPPYALTFFRVSSVR